MKKIMMMLVLSIAAFSFAETLTLTVAEDASVDSRTPTANIGGEETLGCSGVESIYLRFDSAGFQITNIVNIAAYHISVQYPRTADIYLVTNNLNAWSENIITWNTAPANNLDSEYPVLADTVRIGTLDLPAAYTQQTVDFTFDSASAEQILIDWMNEYGSATLTVVRPGASRYCNYTSKESTLAGAHPFQMEVEGVAVSTSPEGIEVSQDATIKPTPDDNTNFGSAETLQVASTEMYKSYIQFDSPDSRVVDIVSMSAFALAAPYPRGAIAYMVTGDAVWDESTITWNNAPDNNLESKYPDSTTTTRLGAFGNATANQSETKEFVFDDDEAKQLLISAMNLFDKVTLVLVRSDRYVNYPSKEDVSTPGAHPINMVLTVEGDGGGGYALWALDNGLTYGVNDDPTDDPDGDGWNNLYEYGLGGDPTNSVDSVHAPMYSAGSGGIEYIYDRLSAIDSGLIYYLELTDDLVSGVWSNAGYSVDGISGDVSGFESVTNLIPVDVKPEQFIRLMIEKQ